MSPTGPVGTFYQDFLLPQAELAIKEMIISAERQSHDPDPNNRTRQAIEGFNRIFQNPNVLTRLVSLDHTKMNRPLFETIHGARITIQQLSDGEKQLYGRVMSLMSLNPNHAVILIDEPELFLHPRWQYDILDIYRNIGHNNQFIIATHSPYILSKCHYSELILLKKQGNRIVVEQPDRPLAAQDINSILGIMEADFMPRETMERHRKYRALVESGQKDTEEGRALLAEILEHEPEQSEFLQRIRFYEELNS